MKKRILFVAVLIISLFINSISPVLAALDPIPVPQAPFIPSGLYQTDLFTGAASYSYPIKVPKGTNDLTPEVALSYTSHGTFAPSASSGMGWELNRDYIERDVNFTPGSTSDDKFYLHFKGTTQELVYVAGDGRYHTKIESNLHITKLTSGEDNDYNEYWQVITPDGTKYRFGQGTNSEQVCNGRSSVYRWNLDQVEDRHTNKIFYTYTENSGASYLDKIEYNSERSRIIDFEYITNPYQRQVYVQGCNITETSILSNIEVQTTSESGGGDFSIEDETSNNNDLTNNNSVSDITATTPFGESSHATGYTRASNTSLSAADSSATHFGSGEFTIEMWLYRTADAGSDEVIIDNRGSTSTAGWVFFIDSSDALNSYINGLRVNTGANTIPLNSWTHVAFVRDGDTLKAYINGVERGSYGFSTGYNIANPSGGTPQLKIGIRSDNTMGFSGNIDDVRIWNTAKTATEINNNKSVELTGSESGLTAYYPMEGIGSTPLVRQFDLSYATASNSGQLLQSITERGSDATASALPATIFSYKPEVRSIATQSERWINNADIDVDLTKTDVVQVDVTGDGLVDIVKTGGEDWRVLINQATSWSTEFQLWGENIPATGLDRTDTMLVDVTGDNLPDIVREHDVTWRVYRNTGTSWGGEERWIQNTDIDANLSEGNGRNTIMDVNGDSLADIVRTVDHGGGNVTWEIFKNTGSSWNTTGEKWLNNTALDATTLDDSNVRLMDVNGDGLPDIVRTSNSGSNATWRVYKNTGSSWNTTYETWINNANIDAYIGKADVTVADINGDGLLDIVKSDDNGSADRWKALLNQGNSWSTTWVDWLPASANIDLSLQSHTQMIDVTGDALPDIVKGVNTGVGSHVHWDVWKNNGKAAHLLSQVHTSQGGKISFDYANSVTQNSYTMDAGSYTGEYFNNETLSGSPVLTRTDNAINFDWGTGSPHASVNANNFSVRWTKTASFSAGAYTFATRSDDGVRLYIDGELLIDKWIEQGATVYSATKMLTEGNHTIVYEYYEDNGSAVADLTYSKSGLPFSLWLVDTMTLHNGMTNAHQTNDITTYAYKNGFYDWQDREFRGFGEVTETLPNTAKRKYIFYQDDGLKGRLSSVNTNDTNNIPYEKLEQTWSSASSSGVFTVNLATEKQYTYDGATASAKVTETAYQYDSYGNPTKISELGDTSTASDDRFTYNEYTASTSAWLVNTLKHTYRNDADDSTKVSETYLYYDQHSGNDDAPHFGDVTKKVDWLSGGSNPETHYTYDSYGNVISTTDANGHTTTMTYDDTGTYSESQTNAKNQTVTMNYEFGTGNVLSQTDSNNLTTSYEYDIYGRITKEIKPYDSSSYPTISYQYLWDGIAPEAVMVSKRETASGSATLDTYTITDGLGRKIQTRADAENSSQQRIVDTYYDSTGQVTKETVPYSASSSATIPTPTPTPLFDLNDKTSNNNDLTNNNSVSQVTATPFGASSHAGGFVRASNQSLSAVDSSATHFGSGEFTIEMWLYRTADAGSDEVLIDNRGTTTTSGWVFFINSSDALDSYISGLRVNTGANTIPLNTWTHVAFVRDGDTLKAYINGVEKGTYSLSGGYSITDPGGGTPALKIGLRNDNTNGFSGTIDEVRIWNTAKTPTEISNDKSAELTGSETGLVAYYPLEDTLGALPEPYTSYATPDPTAKYTEYEYDVLGRVSIMTSPKGDMKTTAYDHWKVTNIDEKGAIKRNYLNAFDKITKVEEVLGATTSATLYTYNARDDLTQIVDDASNVFSFVYDTLSRKTGQTDPDMGTWSYGYDAVGNLTSTTDARSVTTTRTYDELNRLTGVNYPSDTDTSFAYDLGKIGTLAIATDSAGTVSYTYDNRLRKTEESRTINGTTKTTSFAYDALDRLTNQTNPDSEVVTYTFNNQGEIESATGSANLVSNFDYNALGKITKKDFGNGVTTNYTYNTNDFRLNRIQTGSLFDKNYTYDDVGNIATITDNLTAKVQTFTYDDLDRLTTASESAGFDYEYEYNSIGNLTSFTASGSATNYTYGQSAGPHALTSATESASFVYDNNGNMTGDGFKLFEYNEANQLKRVKLATNSATLAEYVYDYNGKRIVKKNYNNGVLGNTVTSWTPSYETKVIEGGATTTTVYYYANNELIARKNNDGTRTFYHTDHLGSTSVLTNQAGSLVEATSYDPWGEVLSGGTMSRFQYTGKEKDAETGLSYYESRYYNPDIQHFVQPDTWLPNIYDPQQLNRYSYANNNPLKYTDPTGHFSIQSAWNSVVSFFTGGNAKKESPPPVSTLSSKTIEKSLPKNTPINLSSNYNQKPTTTDRSGDQAAIKAVYDFAIGDDINTLRNPNAGLGAKSLAVVGLASNVGGLGARVGVKAGINITQKGLSHILERHVASGIYASRWTSIFSNPEEITTLIKNADDIEGIMQGNGNLRRIVDADKIIGVDRVTGKETSLYTVITDATNNLITAHPGIPSR